MTTIMVTPAECGEVDASIVYSRTVNYQSGFMERQNEPGLSIFRSMLSGGRIGSILPHGKKRTANTFVQLDETAGLFVRGVGAHSGMLVAYPRSTEMDFDSPLLYYSPAMDNSAVKIADGAPLSLQVVANRCTAGSCPTIYRADDDRYVVQGFTVTAERAGIELPEGEMLVEIPAALLREALRELA